MTLALFDLEAPEWVRIYQPRMESLGWHSGDAGVPVHDDGSKVTEAEWKSYLKWIYVCRDCGGKTSGSPGGAGREGGYSLCEPCAAIDGCTIRPHEIIREERPCTWNSDVTELAHCTRDSWFLLEFDRDELEQRIEQHTAIRHTSRWGRDSHPPEQHDELVAAQARRRSAYFKSQNSGSEPVTGRNTP